jgi:hypothetical protein
VGHQPRLRRPAPAFGAVRRRPPPRRTTGRPRPDSGRAVVDGARRGPGRPRGARRPRPHRLAEDHRFPRLPHLRPHRPGLDLPRGAPGRGGPGPRDRRTRAAYRDEPVVEGGAARRLRRLQPERQGPHHRRRLLGAPDAGRPRLRRRCAGTRSPTATRRLHDRHHAGPLRRDRRPVGPHRRVGRLAGVAPRARRPAEGRGPVRSVSRGGAGRRRARPAGRPGDGARRSR